MQLNRMQLLADVVVALGVLVLQPKNNFNDLKGANQKFVKSYDLSKRTG